jgi:sugar (pentulose or hexulose) kinase
MWFLGIDVGTTHVKVVAETEDGRVLPALRTRTPEQHDGDLTFHDADEVWQAAVGLAGAYAGGPAAGEGPLGGVAVASFGQEEAVGVDASGHPVCPSLAWWESFPGPALGQDDTRWFDSPGHYARSGIRYRPMQSPERLAQLRRADPEAWKRMEHWADFGAYVAWKLCGNWASSATQLTHSQFFDATTLEPDPESLDRLGVDPGLFPGVRHVGERLGDIRPGALPGVNLAGDAGVFVGGHDQVLAAFACASSIGTDVFDSIGTSEYLMVVTDGIRAGQEAYERGLDFERAWCPERFVAGCGIPSGKVIQLLVGLFHSGDYDAFFEALRHPAPSLPSLRLTVSDLGDPADGLISLGAVPAGASPASVVRACVDQLTDLTGDTLRTMCRIAGAQPRTVALMGSLFQHEEMVARRREAWGLPLTVTELAEPVATGAARTARHAYQGKPLSQPGERA